MLYRNLKKIKKTMHDAFVNILVWNKPLRPPPPPTPHPEYNNLTMGT